MEAALRPGRFIRYGESFAFVQGLERIARSIDGLVAEAPARAADLFETFLAGCYQKSEEIDDSSGAPGGRLVRRRDGRDLASLEGAGRLPPWARDFGVPKRPRIREDPGEDPAQEGGAAGRGPDLGLEGFQHPAELRYL
jgi:hypothetical protein